MSYELTFLYINHSISLRGRTGSKHETMITLLIDHQIVFVLLRLQGSRHAGG